MINISLTNAIGFPGLSQNNPANPLVQTILPSIYEYGNSFSIDAVFTYVPETMSEGSEDPYSDIELTYKGYTTEIDTVVSQINTKTFRISGRAIDVFLDAFYQFLMPDNTLKILPADTTETFLALTRYNPPSIKRKTVTHTINYDLKYIANPLASSTTQPMTINNNIVFTQDVVWNYDIAVTQFQNVLAKGVI